MATETKERILKAALKLFAANGYKGATTRAIAKEAGVSELTLFRSFKTKENLLNEVVAKNTEKLRKEFELIINETPSETPQKFLENIIRNLDRFSENNIEFMRLVVTDLNVKEPVLESFFKHLSQHLEKNIPNKKLDYDALAFLISGFVVILNNTQYLGRKYIKKQEMVEGTIKNLTRII